MSFSRCAVDDDLYQRRRHASRRREERVVSLLHRSGPILLPWFVSVRMATAREDRMGIDAVVFSTDLGELHLQVKSSVAGLLEYVNRAVADNDEIRLETGVVVVRDYHPDEVVLGHSIGALKPGFTPHKIH